MENNIKKNFWELNFKILNIYYKYFLKLDIERVYPEKDF